ncbi:hypothetical protein [Agrococcus sp. Marseille-Q4369]|nr:hypothetical protein [Agrococcus sp. Marseille-Q4369]QUW18303.1 hypothetical protein JSQ78_10775 [Agrococcus sp. Marseille-Q4369]
MTGIDPNAQDPGQDEAAEETNAHTRAEQDESPAEAQRENAEESDGYGY